MIGKVNWEKYLHGIRRREIEEVFSMVPKKYFEFGLEIGAGDGYQTTLLAPRCARFISSDLNFKRIKESNRIVGVEYRTLDADNLAGVFSDGEFDFIFSSNVLEHLGDRSSFLNETFRMLRDDGYAVHIVPTRMMKVSYLLLHFPNLCVILLDRCIGLFKGKKIFRGADISLENNIHGVPKEKERRFEKLFYPRIHGNYVSHSQEYRAWSKRNWQKLFIEHHFKIVAHKKGPVFSGYGFGVGFMRAWLEMLGFSSEHIFVLRKMDDFELTARAHTAKALPNAHFYEREKFVKDWLTKREKANVFYQDFTRAVGEPSGKKVIDVGFGNGILLSEFAKHGSKVYGLEIDDGLYSIAQKIFAKENVEGDLRLYDGEHFPFDSNFFDYAYSTSVLEHMSNPSQVICEVARTLTVGGKFYLSFPNKYNLKESHTGLWAVSVLPRPIAAAIIRLYGSRALEDWNLHFISFFDLKKMAKKANLRIHIDTNASRPHYRLAKRMLKLFGIHYGILLKTIILVLEKPAL